MNNKKIYILGHRNPDTDSVVSAAAYAYLKHALGMSSCAAARAGKIAPQTEYIFNRFKVPVPEYLPDLLPKTAHYISSSCETANENMSLWTAAAKIEECDSKVLPVVDDKGSYKALLHYNAFARNVLKVLNPEKAAAVTTSISLIQQTLSAQPLFTFRENEQFKCSIIVAASCFESFQKMLNVHLSENVIVIAGDRRDVHEYCIDQKVRALVISAGFVLDKDLRAKAEANGVSVLISPYDTSSTGMLIVYSSPVSVMADSTIRPVRSSDLVRAVRPLLSQSPGRSLPVVDDDNRVIGIISESDLLHEPNIEVIMVDHNEISQAIEGIENYKILEVIDHHRVGSLSTRYPITFINKPVGATSTIIAGLFRENHISIPREIASILLCGILSDTLILQSATTTDTDRVTAEYLSNITALDIDTLGSDIMTAASRIGGRSADEVIHQDMKDYEEESMTFSVSQIEVDNPGELLKRKEEFIGELEIERRTRRMVFSALMVTDITKLTSILLIAAENSFMSAVSFPLLEERVYVLNDIVSRKKQLIPLLSEIVERYAATR